MANLYNRYLRTRKALSILGNVVRCILLLATLTALGTYWIWHNHEDMVESADNTMVASYVNGYVIKHNEAIGPLKEGNYSEASKKLEALLTEMGNVTKQDRLASLYFETQAILLRVYRSSNNREAALATAKAMVDFDDGNHIAWQRYARELKVNNRKDEMTNALHRAFLLAPPNPGIAKELAGLLYEDGRVEEARVVADRYLNWPLNVRFSIFWAIEGEDFSQENKKATSLMTFIQDRVYSVRAPIEKTNVKKIMISFPDNMRTVGVNIVSISVQTGKGWEELNIKALKQGETHSMTMTGRERFVISGADPFIILNMPESFKDKLVDSVLVKCAFKTTQQELKAYL